MRYYCAIFEKKAQVVARQFDFLRIISNSTEQWVPFSYGKNSKFLHKVREAPQTFTA
jgi:hypothetical protein